MKMTLKIVIVCSLIFFIVGCITGIIYTDKTINIPSYGYYEIDGYFTNIQKCEPTIIDGQYPYFTYGTGASTEEAGDYKKHPENYNEYVVELHVKNYSNYAVYPIWAVSPGYQADAISVKRRLEETDVNRMIWINCWLGVGITWIETGEEFTTNIHIIVKTEELGEQEIQKLLMETQINLQMGIIREREKYPLFDFSREINFNYPIFYKE